jgi:hypothetical protein
MPLEGFRDCSFEGNKFDFIIKIGISNKISTKTEIQRNVTTFKLWYNSKIKSVNHLKNPIKSFTSCGGFLRTQFLNYHFKLKNQTFVIALAVTSINMIAPKRKYA